MFNFSMGEMLILAVIALVFIGPKQMPEIARTIAKLMNELKRATGDLTQEFMNARDQVTQEMTKTQEEISAALLKEPNSTQASTSELPPHKPDTIVETTNEPSTPSESADKKSDGNSTG